MSNTKLKGAHDRSLASALSLGLHAVSVVFTDVIRAMLLFYMTLLWSALLGPIVLKQWITVVRAFTMALALAGMLTMFGLGDTVPLPRNAGDWMGLGAGLFWAITAGRLRQDHANSTLDLTGWSFQCALPGVTAAGLLATTAMPDLHALERPLPWLVPVALLRPALVDSIWDVWQARRGAAAGAIERTRTSTVLPTSTSS